MSNDLSGLVVGGLVVYGAYKLLGKKKPKGGGPVVVGGQLGGTKVSQAAMGAELVKLQGESVQVSYDWWAETTKKGVGIDWPYRGVLQIVSNLAAPWDMKKQAVLSSETKAYNKGGTAYVGGGTIPNLDFAPGLYYVRVILEGKADDGTGKPGAAWVVLAEAVGATPIVLKVPTAIVAGSLSGTVSVAQRVYVQGHFRASQGGLAGALMGRR